MKQGRASFEDKGNRPYIKPKAVSPVGVAGLGSARGNHATDGGDLTLKREPFYTGKGFPSPGPKLGGVGVGGGRTIYRSGTQGKR